MDGMKVRKRIGRNANSSSFTFARLLAPMPFLGSHLQQNVLEFQREGSETTKMSSSFQPSDVRSFPLRLPCTHLLYHYCKTRPSSSSILFMEQKRPPRDNGSPVGIYATNKNKKCCTPTPRIIPHCCSLLLLLSLSLPCL